MKSKFYLLIMISKLLISVCEISNAQSPEWLWAKSIGATDKTGLVFSRCLTVDPGSGDIYASGEFYGNIDFDPGPGSFNLNSSDGRNCFISKLDGTGNFKWIKAMKLRLESPAFPPPYSYGSDLKNIAVDHFGSKDVYLTGYFSDTTDFDPSEGIFNLSPVELNGNCDVFISKLDSSGNFVWAKRVGGIGAEQGISITVDPAGSGNLYITGYFEGTVDFDPGPDIHNLTAGPSGFNYISQFILKLDALGHFVWAKAFVGFNYWNYFDNYKVLSDIGSGDIYITGGFEGTVDFDPGPDSFNLTSAGGPYNFISKLDSSGNFSWVKLLEHNFYDFIVSPSDGRDVYGISLGGLISKLDSSGNLVWTKQLETTDGFNSYTSIACDPSGSGAIYTIGKFGGTVDFDPGPDLFNLTSAGSQDIFLSKLDGHFNFVWAKKIEESYNSVITSISTDNYGNAYIMGHSYSPSIPFGSITLTNSNNSCLLFIAKLDTAFTVSLADVDSETPQIHIYPNPATNELTIKFEDGEYSDTNVTLFNILGEVVLFSPDVNIGHKESIDISALVTGIYFVELNIDGRRVIEKVVKE